MTEFNRIHDEKRTTTGKFAIGITLAAMLLIAMIHATTDILGSSKDNENLTTAAATGQATHIHSMA
jgi:hypothetical protein